MKQAMLCGLYVVALTLAVGCSKKEGDGSGGGGGGGGGGGACGPAKIVAGGKEIALKKGLVVWEPDYKVTLFYGFNHDEATCENAISGRFSVPDNAVHVRMSDSSTDAIGIDSYTYLGKDVNVSVKKKGEKAGDPVEVCVGEVTFKPNNGQFKDQDVTVSGKFAGEFCGEMKK